MFRVAVPLALLAVAIATLVVSNRLAPGPEPSQPLGVAAATVPLLSAQRLPTVTTGADAGTDAAAEAPTPAAGAALPRDLAALVIDAPAQSCVVVRQEGQDLFAKDPDEPLVPASVQKLATAHAALSALGPEHTYRTVAIAATEPAGGVLQGDLYLLGGGDPLLATDDYAPLLVAEGAEPTLLDDLAADLTAGGLTLINGGVIAIEDRYDTETTVESWPESWVEAGSVGTLNPAALNQGYRTQPGISTTAGLAPEPEPALRTAVLFDDMLEARSVRIPQRPGVAQPGTDFENFVELGSISSAPLGSHLRYLLTESDNTTAEMVLKEVGLAWTGTGSTLDGALAVLEVLATDAGRPILVFPPVDGSGLSPDNRLTCRQVSDILEIGGPDGTLASYLPTVAVSGTLEDRFGDSDAVGRVRAKTGTLPGVSSLAGFATGADGRPITFAVILNEEGLIDSDADSFLQRLMEILVSHPEQTGTG